MPTCESSELLEQQAIDNTVVELPADMDRFGDLNLSGTSNELQNGRAVIGKPSSKSINPIWDVPYRGGDELEQSTERHGWRFGKQSDELEKAIVDATTQDRSTEMFDGTSKERSLEDEKEGEVGPVAGSVPGQDTPQKRPYCKQCLKAAVVCICASVPKVRVPNRTKLVVLQHYKETKHPLGSVRFAKLGFENVSVVVVKELGSGLPWMKPPFSRKERAVRSRALAEAHELAVAAGMAKGEDPLRSDGTKENSGKVGEKGVVPEGLVGGQIGASNKTEGRPSKPFERSGWADTGGALPDSEDGKCILEEKLPNNLLADEASCTEVSPPGAKSSLGESSSSTRRKASKHSPGHGAARAGTPLEDEVPRWERDHAGRKVRHPTFNPPPGIELTPGTAVLFPGPDSVDLLDAAEFWGLAVHCSPFSPAVAGSGGPMSVAPEGVGTSAGSPEAVSLPSGGDVESVPATRAGLEGRKESQSCGSSENKLGESSAGGAQAVERPVTELGVLGDQSGHPTEVTDSRVTLGDVTEQLGAASLGDSDSVLSSGRPSKFATNPPNSGVRTAATTEPVIAKSQNPGSLLAENSTPAPNDPQNPSALPAEAPNPASSNPQNPVAFPAEPPDQLILIDGTWSKATRVYYEHGWLHSLPQYKLPLGKRTSRYKNLRKEPKKEYLSTLESGAWALQLIEPGLVEEIEGVLDSFGEMIKRQAEYQAEAVRQGRCRKMPDA